MPRSLADWLEFIEQLNPREIDLGLDRVRAVATALGLGADHRHAPLVITVAGTNGKGSCVHLLQAQCLAAGRSVLTYTSPHLVRYNERVRMNGTCVSDAQLCEAFQAVEQGRGDIPLTYFEFGTLAALWICARLAPDVLLLEVGMGGRLDAVNCVDADLAILTSVALDHCDWLGNDREQIGAEKAGVFRAQSVAVCADPEPPESVLRRANDIGARLLCVDRDFSLSREPGEHTGARTFHGQDDSGASREFPVPCSEDYPAELIAALVQACLSAGLPFNPAALDTRLPGRWQRFSCADRELILDVAHNVQATTRLARRVRELPALPAGAHTLAVIGLLGARDVLEVAGPLADCVDYWLTVSTEGIRGCSAESLSGKLCAAGWSARALPAGAPLLAGLLEHSRPGDRLLVFGSFQLPGALLDPNLTQLRDIQPWIG